MFSKKEALLGNLKIGGKNKILVEGFLKSYDKEELCRLICTGADFVRLSLPNKESVKRFCQLKEEFKIPFVGDIHFDWRVAKAAAEAGIEGIRINPANISKDKIKEIVKIVNDFGICLRVGINKGSFYKKKDEDLFLFTKKQVDFIEDLGCKNITISVKSTDIDETIQVNQKIKETFEYPICVGLTEAGPLSLGIVKSTIFLTKILEKKIPDAVRVSLTCDSQQEVIVAREILEYLGFLERELDFVSCPTCQRCKNKDILMEFAQIAYKIAKELKFRGKVAVMGCEVNGPKEASFADIGIFFAKDLAFFFKEGKLIKKTNIESLERLKSELLEFLKCKG